MNEAPEKLADRDIWLIWRYEEREDADGEPYQTKVPMDPRDGGKGDAADRDDGGWTDFDSAVRACGNYPDAEGLGFAFPEGDILAGVDLDDVVDPETGELREWAADVVSELDSYTEYSPSGTGLHTLVFGMKPGDKCRTSVGENNESEIEIYDDDRFFTYTGNHFDGAPEGVKQRNDELSAVYKEYLGGATGGGSTDDDVEVTLDSPADADEDTGEYESLGWPLDDWREADPTLDELFETANPSKHYPSASEADYAAAVLLVHLEYSDTQIASILRQYRSRDKMGRDDYVKTTIKSAKRELSGTASEPAIEPNRGDSDTLVLWKLRHFAVASDTLPPYGFTMQETDDGDEYLGFTKSAFDRTVEGLNDAEIEHGRERIGSGRIEPPEFEFSASESADVGSAESDGGAITESSTELIPQNVMAEAGLDPNDDDLSDLPDREKAYRVWSLIERGEDEHFIASQPDGTIFNFDDGIWVDEGKQRLRELARPALGPVYSKNVHTELIEQARADAPMRRSSMGAPRATVAVNNGLYHLDTGTLEPLAPDDYAIFRANAEYRDDADCPRFREFVNDVVREDDLDTLQEYAGYTLLHWGQPYKRAMLLLGPQDSGKSTFLNVLKNILGGNDNVSAENLNSLVNERWGKASLFGKVANITNELETKTLDSVGLFKTLTGGGDTISAEFKGKDKFDFVPTAKQLFATNQVPPTNDTDDAFYSRWVFASFPESVPPAKQVPDLDDKMLEEERAGILNWMIEGYERLREQGGFTNDPMSGDKRERWEAYGNSIKRFKHNCLQVTGDANDAVAKSISHALYSAYCHEKIGSEVEGQRKLTSELKKDKKISDSKRKLHPDDQRRKVYTGVKYHPDALDALDFEPGTRLAEMREDNVDDDVDDGPDDSSLSGFEGGA